MSVDYTAWAGYGVVGPIDEPTDLVHTSKVPETIRAAIDLEDLEGEMDKWLEARGIDKVSVFVGGNAYSGRERWSMVVSSSVTSVDEMEPVSRLTQPSDEELAQLEQAMRLVGIEDKPGWMLQMDIS